MARSVPAWVTILVLSLCGFVAALQFTLVIPLLPDFPTLLNIDSTDASWLVTITLLTSAVSTPIVARMADMYGKRRMLVFALSSMLVGSVICAVEASFEMMLAGRALQGLGSSVIAVGISIMRDELPSERVSTAVALMSATMGIGSALGLPLAGLLMESLNWHAVFWFGAAASALLIAALYAAVAESTVRTPGRFDTLGALVLSAALVALLLPISKGSTWGWASLEVMALFATAGLLFALWLPLELRTSQPMVDLRTAARREILATNIASLFAGTAMFVNMLVTVQLLQLPTVSGFGFGLSVYAAGLCMVPGGLAMVALSPVSGALLDRWGGRSVLLLGLTVMGVSYVGRVWLSNSITEIVVGSTLVSLGTALAFAAMPTLIMGAVPITETAAANGLNALVRAIGTSIGSTVVAAFLAASTFVSAAGDVYPTEAAFEHVLWFGAAASAIGAALTFLIPARARAAKAKAVRTGSGDETILRGRLTLGQSTPRGSGTVALLGLDGDQIDWSRIDHDGRYSLAVPGEGSYVAVANAPGWAPTTTVFDFSPGQDDLELALDEELTISGTVTIDGHPCAGATVVLRDSMTDRVLSTTSDEAGHFVHGLPPVGYYVLVVVDPITRRSHAQKLAVTVHALTIDVRLPA